MWNPIDAIKDAADDVFDFVGDAVDAGTDFVGDAVGAVGGGIGEAVDFIGDAVEGAVDFAGGVAEFLGPFLPNPLLPMLPGLPLPIPFPSLGDFIKDPGSIKPPIIDWLPGPKAGQPEADGGLPDLSGLDPMTALFVIMSYIQKELGEKVEMMGTLTQIQTKLQEAMTKDQLRGDGETTEFDSAKAALTEQFGEELKEFGLLENGSELDLGSVTSAVEVLTRQIQQGEQFRQQLNTMASNLLKSDHEAKMVTLRNIPTR